MSVCVCMYMCLYFRSFFQGVQLDHILASDSGSGNLLIRVGVRSSPSRSATLRFFSLAEQCHTQKFYLRCFKADSDAVKSKFGLLIEFV